MHLFFFFRQFRCPSAVSCSLGWAIWFPYASRYFAAVQSTSNSLWLGRCLQSISRYGHDHPSGDVLNWKTRVMNFSEWLLVVTCGNTTTNESTKTKQAVSNGNTLSKPLFDIRIFARIHYEFLESCVVRKVYRWQHVNVATFWTVRIKATFIVGIVVSNTAHSCKRAL